MNRGRYISDKISVGSSKINFHRKGDWKGEELSFRGIRDLRVRPVCVRAVEENLEVRNVCNGCQESSECSNCKIPPSFRASIRIAEQEVLPSSSLMDSEMDVFKDKEKVFNLKNLVLQSLSPACKVTDLQLTQLKKKILEKSKVDHQNLSKDISRYIHSLRSILEKADS